MKILVVLAHPDRKSFNHAIAERIVNVLIKNRHDVTFHDLYEERFDPVIPASEIRKNGTVEGKIQHYCNELSSCDGIIFIHPNWWGQPPAILKGWIDRVVRPGVAYKFNENDSGEGIPEGLLKAQIAVVINISDTEDDRERSVFGDPLENIWKKCIFEFCGIKNFFRKTFRIIVTSTKAQRKNWLDESESITKNLFPSTK